MIGELRFCKKSIRLVYGILLFFLNTRRWINDFQRKKQNKILSKIGFTLLTRCCMHVVKIHINATYFSFHCIWCFKNLMGNYFYFSISLNFCIFLFLKLVMSHFLIFFFFYMHFSYKATKINKWILFTCYLRTL